MCNVFKVYLVTSASRFVMYAGMQ